MIDTCQTPVRRSSAAAIRGGKIPGAQNLRGVRRTEGNEPLRYRPSEITVPVRRRSVSLSSDNEPYTADNNVSNVMTQEIISHAASMSEKEIIFWLERAR